MGSFIGHAVPGAFFFAFGLWWLTQAMRRHFLCRKTRQEFRSTLAFPVTCVPALQAREIPMEPIVKIFLCSIGIGMEIVGGINSQSHRFDSIGNTQHITMYFFFAFSGVMDLLTLRGFAPDKADYLGLLVALMIEGALFKFHLFGRSELDVLIHTLLLYVIAFSALVVVLEAAYSNTALLPMLRALLTMLQGTWFWALGFILYNPLPGAKPWDPKDHHSLMFAVVLFSWHVAAGLLLALAVGAGTAFCHRKTVHYAKLGGGAGSPAFPLTELGRDGGEETEPLTGVVHNGCVTVFGDCEDDVRLVNGGGRVLCDDDSDVEFQAPVRK